MIFLRTIAHHIIEKMYEDELEKVNSIETVYLPHRSVIKEEQGTTKVTELHSIQVLKLHDHH